MKIWILLCCLFPVMTFAQVNVTTVSGPFSGSGGVSLGPDGLIYIADYGDGLQNQNGTVVWRYNPATGIRDTFATGFSGASGNDFDSKGNLFQANIAGNSISKVDTAGNVSTFATQGLSAPVGIAIDKEDNLYVCNCGDNTIRKITPQGVSTLFASGNVFRCPNGITIDHEGFLYVSNFNGGGTIVKIDSLGNPSIFSSFLGVNNGHITFSKADTCFYLASHAYSQIFKIDMDGSSIDVLAGSGTRGNEDGPSASATFSRPNGIAVSVTGDTLFVNSSVPTTNVNFPLNPSLLRMISGLISLGLKEERQGDFAFKLYPNPAGDVLYIRLGQEKPCALLSLKVMDTQGRLVVQQDDVCSLFENRQITIDIKNLPPALYLLTLEGRDYNQHGYFKKN